jgi:CheY-like chemotaxis protein
MSQSPLCLLVDDEPRVRAYISTVLRNSGFEVLEAEDGIQGLAEFRRSLDRIDVVVSDFDLPGLNGLDLAARIRAEMPRMPVLLISGYMDIPGTGEIPLLQKPFLPAKLLTVVQQVIAGMAASAMSA